MLERVLLPVDLSEVSDQLLKCVGSMAKAGMKELTLIHVVDFRSAAFVSPQLQEHNTAELRMRKQSLSDLEITVRTRVPIGIPYVEILEAADDIDADLILMGSKGQTFLQRVLLGSIAEYVLNHSKRPVMLMKFDEDTEEADAAGTEQRRHPQPVCTDPFAKVLHATDFSTQADATLSFLKSLPSAIPELILLHVQDERSLRPHLMDRIDEFNARDMERLERIQGDLTKAGFQSIKTRLETGQSVSLIPEIAEEENASLIAMGAKGRSNLKEMLLGSVTQTISRHSRVPVLIVPAKP